MKVSTRMTSEILEELFLRVLKKSTRFTFLEGIQPFKITFDGLPYYVYIKLLSSAYFKDRPDTTRAQLPVRPDFDEIKKSSIPFIFLGYDINNDVYVCWNYHIVKTRLNEKESVSFYSRVSFQKEAKEGVFLRKKLKNDDTLVLFKRTDLISFFEKIGSFYNEKYDLVTNDINPQYDGKIYEIKESELLEKIYLLVNEKSNNILAAITLAKEFYGDKYPSMKYSDWSNLIKSTRNTYTITDIPETKKEATESVIKQTNLVSNKKLTVKEIIVEILKGRDGEASYSEIYTDYEKYIGSSISNAQKAGIRAVIERASSDSTQFAGKEDLFYTSQGKGKGVWGLRNKQGY